MSAKDELMGGGMDEESSESETEKADEDKVAKAMFSRFASAVKNGDATAGLEAFKKLMAACPPGSDDDYEEAAAE
jgi:hypothetical protein